MTYPRFFATSTGSALWAPEVPGLLLRFHGTLSLVQYQQLLNTGLEIYRRQAPPAGNATWIADTRQLYELPVAARHWMATEWNGRAYEAGLRHLRLVEAKNSHSLTQQLHEATRQPAADGRLYLSQHESLSAAIQQAHKVAEISSAAGR